MSEKSVKNWVLIINFEAIMKEREDREANENEPMRMPTSEEMAIIGDYYRKEIMERIDKANDQ